MNIAGLPTKFPIIWAASAGGGYVRTIPNTSQIGINNGYASFPDGFVPLNFTAIGAGGIPPFGQDMNGILKEMTAWDQWVQAGGTLAITYDSSFSTSISGYPKGAVLASTTAGKYWLNTADGNTVNPDGAGTNWVDFFAPLLAKAGGTMTGSLVHCAGSTSVAPAAFQAGVLLTTPTLYAFECDGARLYFTSAGPTRNTIAYTTDAAPSAAKWTTARNLSYSGDVTGTAAVDGHADVATTMTLATVNSNVGSFGDATHTVTLTLNGKGLATAASSNAIPTATTSVLGMTTLATAAQVAAGTDTTHAVTPASLGSNKFQSTGQTISGTVVSASHGLGAQPFGFTAVLHCTSAELDYSVGAEVLLPGTPYNQLAGGTGNWAAVYADTTAVYFAYQSTTRISIQRGNGGTPSGGSGNGFIDPTKWTVIFRAWL